MRNWNEKLYMDAMPGREKAGRPRGDFDLWLREMMENEIRTVVCLAPEEQIAAESPEYAEWRRRQRAGAARAGAGPFELIDIPVDDFHAPEPFVAVRFWRVARQVAEGTENGARVFVHCGAGIGRTGMFAVAVLMQKGYSYEEAYEEINSVGSRPEVPAQREFARRGADTMNEEKTPGIGQS